MNKSCISCIFAYTPACQGKIEVCDKYIYDASCDEKTVSEQERQEEINKSLEMAQEIHSNIVSKIKEGVYATKTSKQKRVYKPKTPKQEKISVTETPRQDGDIPKCDNCFWSRSSCKKMPKSLCSSYEANFGMEHLNQIFVDNKFTYIECYDHGAEDNVLSVKKERNKQTGKKQTVTVLKPGRAMG